MDINLDLSELDKFTTSKLYGDFASVVKNIKGGDNMKSMYVRIDINGKIKCQHNGCIKSACYNNIINGINTCWFHAYTS
jgi:hypothetical protein